jgi:hypothetical protein
MTIQEYPIHINIEPTREHPISLRLLTEGGKSKTSYIELELHDDIELDEADELKEILEKKVSSLIVHHN